jgi:hypothetical protein|mmetsp:Transcript_19616/g.47480  ORF Transcript_19616/g.47480 Transcript_19616/m.47480 type:complete len:97 (+) Transcript_19616:94-384(+)
MNPLSFASVILVVLASASNSVAFAPTLFGVRTTSTHLEMGLFDFLNPKSNEESAPKKGGSGKIDKDVFGGKGDRITVREEEDGAMWIDEPKDKKGK